MSNSGRTPRGRRVGLALVLALLAFAGVGGAAWLMGQIAAGGSTPDPYLWDGRETPGAPVAPPLTPFAHTDPEIMAALEAFAGTYGSDYSPGIPDSGVPPIGSYLPRDLNGPIAIAATLPPPTLAPWPTTTFLDSAWDAGILPTSPPPPTADPLQPLSYGGDNCAPRGLPTDGVLTQRYYPRHGGIDLGVPIGTPVYATHSGRVLFAGWSTVGYGNLVILQNGAFITYYAHLSDFNVEENRVVGAGSIIAWSGNTGNSSGPHIHYETRINDVPVDPLTFESRGYGWC